MNTTPPEDKRLQVTAGLALSERLALRERLYRETWNGWVQRWLLGTAYAVMPVRFGDFPFLVAHTLADAARGGTEVPDPARTLARPDTFGGVCRRISADTIVAAARKGFFPWCHCGPLKWWTREQRMVLKFQDHHIGKRLRRDMKKSSYRVTFDQAFEHVIAACAGHRSYNKHSLTWVTPEIMRLYTDLFDRGHAHSFEVWDQNGRLIGGGYGLSFGRMFATESQFSLEPNTSKIGFAVLNHHLAKWGYVMNDGKDFTPTIEAMGFKLISREEYQATLEKYATCEPGAADWTVTASIAEVAEGDATRPPKIAAAPAKRPREQQEARAAA